MNITARFAWQSAAVCVLLLTAGCASSGSTAAEADAADPNAVAITVVNDLVPPATITIYAVPETGSRRRLGTVTPNGRQTFTFSPVDVAGEYRLVAEHVGGGSTSSNPVVLSGVSTLNWSLSSPAVRIGR